MTTLLTPECPPSVISDLPVTPACDASPLLLDKHVSAAPVVSIVIPAHNEQHNIELLVRELQDVRGQLPG